MCGCVPLLLGEALSDEKRLFVCLYGDRVV